MVKDVLRKPLGVRISEELDREVEIYCAEKGITKQQFVTEALQAKLREGRQQDLSAPFPRTRISFKSREDSGRAWSLVADNKPTAGLPHRGMIADLDQLLKLKQADIPVYRWAPLDQEQRYDEPLDIDKHIETIRAHQKAVAEHERSPLPTT